MEKVTRDPFSYHQNFKLHTYLYNSGLLFRILSINQFAHSAAKFMEAEAISLSPSPSTSSNSSTSLNSKNKSNRRSRSAFTRLCRKLFSRKSNHRSLQALDSDESSEVSSTSSSSCFPIDQLQRVFDYFDKNGDGKISPAELQSCVKTVGGELSIEEAEAAVACSDLDGDGLLGFDEFRKLMEGASVSEDEKKKELQEAFAMYEMEGTGFITASSLRRMLSRLGESRSVDDCKAMIRSFDLNGDGVLSFEEFAIMLH